MFLSCFIYGKQINYCLTVTLKFHHGTFRIFCYLFARQIYTIVHIIQNHVLLFIKCSIGRQFEFKSAQSENFIYSIELLFSLHFRRFTSHVLLNFMLTSTICKSICCQPKWLHHQHLLQLLLLLLQLNRQQLFFALQGLIRKKILHRNFLKFFRFFFIVVASSRGYY